MTWEEVRAHYPNQFIIFEAHQWQDEGECRHILDLTVVQSNCDEKTLLQDSNTMARQNPERQFYPSYTAWESPRIGVPKRRIHAGIGYAHYYQPLHPEPTAHPTTPQSDI